VGWGGGDTSHHLWAILDGAARQVIWDVGPHATTTDIIISSRRRLEHSSKRSVSKL